MKRLEFIVFGVPAPKGSSRAMLVAGAAVNVPSGSRANELALKSWDRAVRESAVEAVASYRRANAGGSPSSMPVGLFFGEGPLRLEIEFRMRRRKGDFNKKDGSLKANVPKYHMVKPDLSKLIRCTEDSMTGIVYLDDAAIAELLVRKVYAAPGAEGARIRITELAP